MIITPAIDILGGRCVRLEKGNYGLKREYSDNPVDTARRFESWGVKRLHLVDLDGAKEKKTVNSHVLKEIASSTGLQIDFGGGIRTEDDIRKAFDNGASMVNIGSIAVSEPSLFLGWVEKFGADRIILGADHVREKIAIHGWLKQSETNLFAFLESNYIRGVRKVVCTDIERDGMLKGPSAELYKRILESWPGMHLIASGGVSGPSDLTLLKEAGLPEVIIGKALYENRITPDDLRKFLISNS